MLAVSSLYNSDSSDFKKGSVDYLFDFRKVNPREVNFLN